MKSEKPKVQEAPESWGFMTAADVGRELGVSTQRARLLIQARIPHIRVGRSEFRVARRDLDQFVQKHMIAPIFKT